MNIPSLPRIGRRVAIKWILTASSAVALLGRTSFGQPAQSGDIPVPEPDEIAPLPPGKGYGTDPDLVKDYKPGDYWPLTLTEDQRRTVTVLGDVILPADDQSPSASAVGVPDFIDEWISAPYAGQVNDRGIILSGLAWLDAEAQRRFSKPFAACDASQHHAICDDICLPPGTHPQFAAAARFFNRFRTLAMGGYYTTPAGMQDVGYVGNMPSATFEGPPVAVLERLGVKQTVA